MFFKKIALFCLPILTFLMTDCQNKSTPKMTNGPLVALETGGCRGYCPQFKLTFSSDGNVEYEGIRSVKRLGKSTFQLTKPELADLEKQLEKIDFFRFNDRYESPIADLPGATLTRWENGKMKSVFGYHDRPELLLSLQKMLMQLTENHGISLASFNPDEVESTAGKTVIVELKNGVNAGDWLAQFTDQRLNLVQRIAPDRNLWLVRFDPSEISQENLLHLLKSSKDVVNVQGNEEVKNRH